MIRIVLLAAGFVAVTLALILMQPGASRRTANRVPVPEQTVTRDDPALTRPQPEPATAAPLAALSSPRPAPAPEPEPETKPEPAPATAATPAPTPAIVAAPAPDTPDDLRRLTWDTLASLNAATGRQSTPGQPGSLLHAIVKRSLDAAPPPAAPHPESYTVQPGDSLAAIAQQVYGDVNMTGPLYAANQSLLTRPDDLRAGQVLTLPKP